MLSQSKINAMKRIKEEYTSINNYPISNIGLTVGLPDEGNIFQWGITLSGPKDTSYKDGIFWLDIYFPDDYPNSKPEVVFRTPIYHVNVNPNKSNMPGAEPLGHVSISTLNWWKPEYKIREVACNIFGLFYLPNPDTPYGLERANEFRFNRALYEKKIRHFTKKYGNPRFANITKKYSESWDFTYP